MVHRRTILATCGALSASLVAGCSTDGGSQADAAHRDGTSSTGTISEGQSVGAGFRPTIPASLGTMERIGNEWIGSSRGNPEPHGVLVWNSGASDHSVSERISRDGERIYDGNGRTLNPDTYALIRLRDSGRYRYRIRSDSAEVEFGISTSQFESFHSATVVEFTEDGAAARTVADAEWYDIFTTDPESGR
ncbi:hypothetical protein [Halopelagius fulvigenes]|uniref:Uncharacterized protein n=1 Tax=Halopelagius fulvigenes TaxID=1198324 RepID=A0ABD5TZ27_9EURY